MGALLRVCLAERRDARAARPPVRASEKPSSEIPVLYRAIALGESIGREAVPGLAVSQPTDHEELEADRIADMVMRGPDASTVPPLRPSGQGVNGGQSLDPTDRDFFGRRFGMDLGGVRVHSDTTAAANARRLSANAFTVGSDISFASGRYSPGTTTGRRLLAHELAHVVQHSARGSARIRREGIGDLRLAEAISQVKSDIVATATYRALAPDDRKLADGIIAKIASRTRPEQIDLYGKLKLLFDTPVKAQATITTETQEATEFALAEEKVRVAKPAAKAATQREEKAAADPRRAKRWVAIKGKFGGGTYFVDRASPTDIVVRAEVMLTAKGTGTAADVNAIKTMEDGIEKAASTKGYLVDLTFVTVAGPNTFHVDVDPSQWEVATNWSGGDPVGFAHELHHMFAFERDRYNYIESHTTNESMEIADRLVWFDDELDKPAGYNDPTSIMSSAPHPNASDVCAVAQLNEKTCIAARTGKKP